MLCLLAPEPEVRAGMAPPAGWLTASEAARLQAFGSAARRDTFLAGRWLARHALQRWRGDGALPALEVAGSGACAAVGAHVSISHSAGFVACVVDEVPVGIDVEDLGRPRDHLALADAVHGLAQREQLAALPAQARALPFLQWWTLKEAWLKARGQGLDFALMRDLAFDADVLGDAATARVGQLVLSVAADRALPAHIEGPPGAAWQRLTSRRLSAA